MHTLHLWGYDCSSLRSQINDTQQNTGNFAGQGLLEKLNQLNKLVQDIQQDLTTTETKITEISTAACSAHLCRTEGDKVVDETLQEQKDIIITLQQTQQELNRRLKILGDHSEDISEAQVLHFGDFEAANRRAEEAHKSILRNINLSIKKFEEYKENARIIHEASTANEQNLIRRLNELDTEKHLHRLI